MHYFIVNVFLLISFTYVLGACSGACKQPTQVYESLKCKPIFASPNDCCPSKYDCSHIEENAKLIDENCLFHGKFYNEGESIDDDEIFGSCRVGCSCDKTSSGKMGFNCASLDCPMVFEDMKPGCHTKYELNKCCSTDVVCPPFSVTCEVNGKSYHEGEQFYSSHNKCTECVCQKEFEGKFEAPFCKKRECLDEVGYQTKIRNFCAPSYITMDDCCPFSWICPDDNNDKITHNNVSNNQDLKCRFGHETIYYGDSFERTDSTRGGKLSCECRIPPFLTCVQDYKYPRNSEDY